MLAVVVAALLLRIGCEDPGIETRVGTALSAPRHNTGLGLPAAVELLNHQVNHGTT